MKDQKIRIAILHFSHETVTFLPNETTLEDFIYPGSPAKGEDLLRFDPRSSMGGFVKVAREFSNVELIGIESPLWPKTGIGSGWVTQEAYQHFVGKMIAGLKLEGPFEGVYLCLHGAMAAHGVPRPEADLARRVREVVGRRASIAATFDLHGNEDEAFLEQADMAFAVKYYPHYDGYLQGERAARTLVRAIRGDYKPVHKTIKIPVISPTVLQWTGAPPWMNLIQQALVWEAREVDVYVNIFFGFPFADVPDVGMTVQVLTNDNAQLAEHVAQDLSMTIWRMRDALLNSTRIYSIADGVARARQAVANCSTPVVLVDHSDRSGSATWLLREIIAQNLANTLIATIADAKATASLRATHAKAGDPFDMEIGGLIDESAGQSVRIQGTILAAVENRGQFWVCVEFGRNNVLILSTYLVQIMEPFSLNALGLDIGVFEVFAIKSRVHFRRGFDDNGFAKTILLVEPNQPLLGTTFLDKLPYKNVKLGQFYPYGSPTFSV
ncbi:M81 family metallopeptidase [Bradyrhizobium glycinis]|uniref:M81 family metallopeptidase n=1 Tax=Bradyrhizobium glycinis TaxID=2751812 RepID=UPI0018D6D359|nr:M81 family metallopeptidase [Bradyrhizobium glycinis]MBH5373491.1 M81 family metallopeptidase [Bradyrhizobium glycinis]